MLKYLITNLLRNAFTWPYITAKKEVVTGAETCAQRKSPSPCLLAIPAFDRIAGLYNRHLNSNRGICLRYRF